MTNPATTYQPLGNFIQIVDRRNRDLQVTKLLGLSIDKCFIPSIANTIGTDMSTYKIIQPRQFAYGPVTSRNGDKITIALYTGDEPAIISQAYVVFEITGTYDTVETQNFASLQQKREQLLPEYLMMWFRRPEFDRYARYHSHGSAREIFDWDEMCATQIPIPPIAEQRAIVAEYAAVQHRMEVNKRLIAILEETAQTLYKKMFVDGVDKENLPDGWRMGTLGEVCEINSDNISTKDKIKTIEYLDSSSVTENRFDEYQLLEIGKDEIPSRAKRKVRYNDIVYSTVRPNLKHYGLIKDNVENIIVSTGFAVLRSTDCNISNELLYMLLTDEANTEILQGIAEMSKATYPSITPDNIIDLKVVFPLDFSIFAKLNLQLTRIFGTIYTIHKENKKLTELQSLLLAKMGR